jgi:predicted RNase H-like HicB family nuclease
MAKRVAKSRPFAGGGAASSPGGTEKDTITAAKHLRIHVRDLSLPLVSLRGLRVKVVLHEAEEGGFWAEVPALPGCVTQGETMDELLVNLREAVQGSLCVFPGDYQQEDGGWVQEVEI